MSSWASGSVFPLPVQAQSPAWQHICDHSSLVWGYVLSLARKHILRCCGWNTICRTPHVKLFWNCVLFDFQSVVLSWAVFVWLSHSVTNQNESRTIYHRKSQTYLFKKTKLRAKLCVCLFVFNQKSSTVITAFFFVAIQPQISVQRNHLAFWAKPSGWPRLLTVCRFGQCGWLQALWPVY